MTWLTWIILAIIFGGTTWVWYQVFGKGGQEGAVSCCGCGQCAVSGECVMVKKRAKTAETCKKKAELS